MDLVIDFNADGSVEAMHTDAFPLSFLGKQTINRATEILFDENTQQWYLSYARYDEADPICPPQYMDLREFMFSGYEAARAAEVKWLNTCRETGAKPYLSEGIGILREIHAARI